MAEGTLGPAIAAAAFGCGAAVGALGGLIGLGGAEFRLPLLLGVFALAAHQAPRRGAPDRPAPPSRLRGTGWCLRGGSPP